MSPEIPSDEKVERYVIVLSEEQTKYLKEAIYKEQLADDIERCGGWQGPLLREAAKRMHTEASFDNG
jgi:hypothetical protein